jgi:hypothetical protein
MFMLSPFNELLRLLKPPSAKEEPGVPTGLPEIGEFVVEEPLL